MKTVRKMKSGKATGLSKVSVEMIIASGAIGIEVILDLCQHMFGGRKMLDKRKTYCNCAYFKGRVI